MASHAKTQERSAHYPNRKIPPPNQPRRATAASERAAWRNEPRRPPSNLKDEIQRYDWVWALYQRVRPGITGQWQISGRNNTSYKERTAMDAYYVRNWSVWLDVYILARTIAVVLKRDGAY